MIDAAERLGATRKLGRAVRAFAAQRRNLMNQEWLLFVNLHPYDLLDPELTDPDSPLMVMADRVVLEITERTPLSSLEEVRDRVVELRQLGFRIAWTTWRGLRRPYQFRHSRPRHREARHEPRAGHRK